MKAVPDLQMMKRADLASLVTSGCFHQLQRLGWDEMILTSWQATGFGTTAS
jgi:hypothetical protein